MLKVKFQLNDDVQNKFYYLLQLDKLLTGSPDSGDLPFTWDLKENLHVCLQVAFDEYLDRRIENLETIIKSENKERENETKNEAI